MSYIIKAKNLVKTYQRGSEIIHAVDNIDFSLDKGSFIAITGPSGSGKTTLINLLGALDNPTQGELYINDNLIYNSIKILSEKQLSKIRRENFGYIFQKFFLIPTLTVQENIFLPHTFYKKNNLNQKNFYELLDSQRCK